MIYKESHGGTTITKSGLKEIFEKYPDAKLGKTYNTIQSNGSIVINQEFETNGNSSTDSMGVNHS